MRLKAQGELIRGPGFRLRADIDVDVEGVAALVGASGAGKSTLLRLISGFEPGAAVTVEVDGERWQDAGRPGHGVPAHRRAVGTVFQESRLFPHATARANLDFAGRSRRPGVKLAFDEVVHVLDLEPLLGQYPHELSGGQRQRVALGRTLLAPAKLWLFDEPMSALDPASRREIAPYLYDLCRRHDVPIVYVSHSLPEVLAIADQVWIASTGSVSAVDSLPAFSTTLDHPLMSDDQAGAVIACRFRSFDARYGLSELVLLRGASPSHGPAEGSFADAPLFVPGDLSAVPEPILLHIPSRDVSLSTAAIDQVSILNRVAGTIDAIVQDGEAALVRVGCGEQSLLARVTRRSVDELGLEPGTRVLALIKSVAVRTGAELGPQP